MGKRPVFHRCIERSLLRLTARASLGLWFIALPVSLAGCQWVFGDYEVVDTQAPVLSEACNIENDFYCDNQDALWICSKAGEPWVRLKECEGTLVCSATEGRCIDPASTLGAADGSTAATSVGGTAAQ